MDVSVGRCTSGSGAGSRSKTTAALTLLVSLSLVAVVVPGGKVETPGETAQGAIAAGVLVLENRVGGNRKSRKAAPQGHRPSPFLHLINSSGRNDCGKDRRGVERAVSCRQDAPALTPCLPQEPAYPKLQQEGAGSGLLVEITAPPAAFLKDRFPWGRTLALNLRLQPKSHCGRWKRRHSPFAHAPLDRRIPGQC